VTISLWVEASRDYDREDADLRLSRAKVAVSSLWPFLSLAKTAAEFEQRLDLAQDTIAMRVEAGMLETVNESLRGDFGIVTMGLMALPKQPVFEKAAALRPAESEDFWENLPELMTKMASTPQIPPQPVGPPPKVPAPRQMQIYSLATRSWITIEANADDAPDSRGNPVGNPYYFDGGLEEGPHTDETGMYPVAPDGPDPISPLQSEYPMQPTAWTPNNAWVERPMQFNTRSAANEHYFSGGTEGVEGDSQTGFPEDVSLPEDDERVDFYGNVPPVHGAHRVAVQKGDMIEVTDHHTDDNGTEIKAGTRSKVHDILGADDGNLAAISHSRRDPSDWGYVPQHKLKVIGRFKSESEYHYVKPNPDGDGYVVTQKDTGKILSHHDTKEDAEASFRAMMQSKHGGSKASPDFRDRSGSVRVLADLGDNPYSGTDNTATNSPVAPPPTMMPGGPGAEAQQPNTNSTSPSDQAAKTSRRLTSAEVRERPSAENPTGVPDEFDSNTWEGFNNQRPRQNAEDRHVNTPQRPREPIHQNTSSGMAGGDGEDEDEGNEREAALHVAAWAVSQALEGIAA
jgi:hypothetical protein